VTAVTDATVASVYLASCRRTGRADSEQTEGRDGVVLTRWTRAGVMAVALAAVACASDDAVNPPPPGGQTGFAAVQAIFTQNCAFSSCHAGSSPREGMNLSAGLAYGNIVGIPSSQVPRLNRVTPSNPDSSYMVLKLEGEAGLVGGVGTRMPLGGSLTQAQIDTIRAWIAAGAPTN